MDALNSPFSADLKASVEAAYDSFGRTHVSRQLETCLCPVCMTQETRADLIATPVRDWSEGLVQEYSNSAHGVPVQLDDLRSIMPRYMELLAAHQDVDQVGVGTELVRFGDAIRQDATFLTSEQTRIYHLWAHQLIMQSGWLSAKEADFVTGSFHLLDMLITGGIDGAVVLGALEALFDHPEAGDLALADFSETLTGSALRRQMRLGADLFGMGYARPQDRQLVADWLNGAPLAERAIAAVARNPSDAQVQWLQALFDMSGQWDAACFPVSRSQT